METDKIENIELKFLDKKDYEELKKAMLSAYPGMEEAYWRKKQSDFKTGQIHKTYFRR